MILLKIKKWFLLKIWIKLFPCGFLNHEIKQNLKVYRENFDIVLTKKDASFNVVTDLLNI